MFAAIVTQMKKPMEIFTVKRSKSYDDLDRIDDFLEATRNENNIVRPLKQMLKVAKDQKLFYIERANSRKIVAISATFRHFEGEFMELGATRVIANGYGFQKLLMGVRIVNEAFFDPEFEELYCTVVPDNIPSIKGIVASGFEKWESPSPKLVEEKKRISLAANRTTQADFYRIPTAKMDKKVQQSALLLLTKENEIIQHRSGEKSCRVTFDIAVMKPPYRDLMEQLAIGEILFSETKDEEYVF